MEQKMKFNIPLYVNKYSIYDLNYIEHYILDQFDNKPILIHRVLNNKNYCFCLLIKPIQCTNK